MHVGAARPAALRRALPAGVPLPHHRSSALRADVTICIPAHDEAATVGDVVRATIGHERVRQVLVVDDGSSDGTAEAAAEVGAAVLAAAGSRPGVPSGKGVAMATAAWHADTDLLVFLDADVTDAEPVWVSALTDPLRDPSVVLVKSRYQRDLHGRPHEGGRVNALLARPLLRRYRPELAHLSQPLSGECAVRRAAFVDLPLEPGYGVEMGMLLDLADRFGAAAITEVDLGRRTHRNRPLRDLERHADVILDVVARREAIGAAPLRALG